MQLFEAEEGTLAHQHLRNLLKPVRMEYQKRYLAAFSDGALPVIDAPTKSKKEVARARLRSTVGNFSRSLLSGEESVIRAVALELDPREVSAEYSDDFLSQQHVDIDALEQSADPSARFRAVNLRSAQGLLTGLTARGLWQGCLDSTEGSSDGLHAKPNFICKKCVGELKTKELPREALINGTWQGLVPEELQGLNLIEMSMIPYYNAITIMGHLKGGIVH